MTPFVVMLLSVVLCAPILTSATVGSDSRNCSKTAALNSRSEPYSSDDYGSSADHKTQPSSANNGGFSSDDNTEFVTLIDIEFVSDFAEFDPRNNASLFQFLATYAPLNLLSDNALFLPGCNSVLEMRSEPFNHYLPQSYGAAAQLQYTESSIMQKTPMAVSDGDILSVELRFSCRTYNVEKNKFPAGSITDAKNDPRAPNNSCTNRLATCGVNVVDFGTTGIEFATFLTNKGIWLKYRRGARLRSALNINYDAFEIYRFAGYRSSVETAIVARVEVDKRLNETRYYIDGKLEWTVGNWGVLSNSLFDGKTRLVGLSPGTPPLGATQQPITPGSLSIVINNVKKLDDADPNGPPTRVPNNSPTQFSLGADASQYSPGLVRLTNLTGIYDPRMTFVDEVSLRSSSLWGQGCKMGLYRLLAKIHTSGTATNNAAEVLNDFEKE